MGALRIMIRLRWKQSLAWLWLHILQLRARAAEPDGPGRAPNAISALLRLQIRSLGAQGIRMDAFSTRCWSSLLMGHAAGKQMQRGLAFWDCLLALGIFFFFLVRMIKFWRMSNTTIIRRQSCMSYLDIIAFFILMYKVAADWILTTHHDLSPPLKRYVIDKKNWAFTPASCRPP